MNAIKLRRPKANLKVDAKRKPGILWRPELARIDGIR